MDSEADWLVARAFRVWRGRNCFDYYCFVTDIPVSHRIIQGLKWARALASRPACIPIGRSRGQKAYGIRYEKALAKALPQADHGQWFEFEDRAGRGFCQTDLMILRGNQIIVLECKYTWTPIGHTQFELLYRPVVEMAFGKKALGLVVSRNLVPGMKAIIARDLDEAIELSRIRRVCWHWLGVSAGPRFGTSLRELVAEELGL